MIDITSIVLGVLTLAGGCGWVVDRRKHKVEVNNLEAQVKALEAEPRQKYGRKNFAVHRQGISCGDGSSFSTFNQ